MLLNTTVVPIALAKCKWEPLRKLCLTIGPQIVRDDTTNGVDVNRSCWYSSVAWWCAVCDCNNSQLKSCIPFIRYVLSEGQQMNKFFVTGVLSLF